MEVLYRLLPAALIQWARRSNRVLEALITFAARLTGLPDKLGGTKTIKLMLKWGLCWRLNLDTRQQIASSAALINGHKCSLAAISAPVTSWRESIGKIHHKSRMLLNPPPARPHARCRAPASCLIYRLCLGHSYATMTRSVFFLFFYFLVISEIWTFFKNQWLNSIRREADPEKVKWVYLFHGNGCVSLSFFLFFPFALPSYPRFLSRSATSLSTSIC